MANKFWVGGTGDWDGTTGASAHWDDADGGAGGDLGPGTGDVAIFNGNSGGGTVTITGTVAVQQITMGAFTGTLTNATNNHNVTLSTALSFTGTGARTLNMGSGTWTLTGTTGTLFDATTMTNGTLTASSAVITVTATATANRTLIFGAAASLGTVNVSANTSGASVVFTAASSTTLTIATLNATAPCRISFTGSGSRVYALTNAATFTGSSGSYIELEGTGTFPTITSANAISGEWMAISALAFAGGGNLTATNSFDLGGVTISGGGSKSITAPSGGAAAARVIGG
jgi:hypothetical protein